MVQREDVLTWVAGYERAWREGDLEALAGLFAEQADYRPSPYEPSRHGLAEIRASWLEDDDVRFTMSAELVAVDGDVAVVRVEVDYVEPVEQQYRDLWLVRFGPDGRAVDFEEWAYWPGKSYSASFDDAAS